MEKNTKQKLMIIIEEKCPSCYGYGYVTHPAWVQYYCEANIREISQEEFFAEYGEIPPEEIECEECNGNGIIERKVELTKKWLLAILNSNEDS